MMARLPMWDYMSHEAILAGMLLGVFTSELFPRWKDNEGNPIFHLDSESD
jgi:hypothetical protein